MSAGGQLARRGEPPAGGGALEVLTGGPGVLVPGIAPIVPVAEATPLWDESGRIRLGYSEQIEGRKGRRAIKLERYRLTSEDQDVVQAAADRYGGQVEEWPEAPGGPQWQVFIEADWLPVIVPPRAAGTQAWEHWDKPPGLTGAELKRAPVVCLRRCDGRTESRTRGPCLCRQEAAEAAAEEGRLQGPGPDERLCKLHTRLSVLLHELPDFGMWRLDTSGWNAGNQLATFLLLVHPGLPPYAKLQLGVRTKRRHKQLGGRWQTVTFPVPVLRPDPASGLTVGDLLATSSSSGAGPAAPGLIEELADAAEQATARAPAGGPGGQATGPGDGLAPPPNPGPGATPANPPPAPAKAGGGLTGPVVAWCLARPLSPGTARMYLVREHPTIYGPDRPLALPNLNALNALQGDPDDPATPAGATVKLLAAKFTETGEPADWQTGQEPVAPAPPPDEPGIQDGLLEPEEGG